MKKTIALLLALLMMLSVSGCAESLKQITFPPLPEVTPTPGPVAAVSSDPIENSETPAPTGGEPTPTVGEEVILPPADAPAEGQEAGSSIFVSIGRTELSENDPAEGTEKILSFTYEMPRVLWEKDPEAAGKINEVLATVEETFYTGNSYGLDLHFMGYNAMLEIAEDNYTYVKEYQVEGAPLEMTDYLSAGVQRLDEGMLSILYADATFTGGAHGSYSQFALCFDTASGELLTLDSLSDDPEALKDTLLQIMLDLAETDEDGYYSDRVVDGFLPGGGREEAFRSLLRDYSWYFDRDGMVIFSNLYELGPYAAGITEFHIPYSQLEGCIHERFLYPAGRTGTGRVSAAALSQVEGGALPIVDKITVTKDGQQVCLLVEGQIYDVRISRVYYVDRFYEQYQIWSADSLSDCALQLETVVPEGLPDLLISYYTADGVRQGKLLSQSGLDGSYLLVDDDIQAVG